MHTVELMEEALAVAAKAGFTIRHEWLGGSGGGACFLKGKKLLFVDLALPPGEQFEHVVEGLRDETPLAGIAMSGELRGLLGLRNAA